MIKNKNIGVLALVVALLVGVVMMSGCIGGCGGSNQDCCEGNKCNSDNFICKDNKCVRCGGIYEPCCEDDKCKEWRICSEGGCERCGGIGELCCEGDKCDEGFCSAYEIYEVSYTDIESYDHIYTKTVPVEYEAFDFECYLHSDVVHHNSKWVSLEYVTGSVTVKNIDDSGGLFKLKPVWFEQEYHGLAYSRGESSPRAYIAPGDTHIFKVRLNVENPPSICNYEVIPPNKTIEKTEIRYRNVTKYRNETRYLKKKVCKPKTEESAHTTREHESKATQEEESIRREEHQNEKLSEEQNETIAQAIARCEKISDDPWKKDKCFINITITTKNASFCDKMSVQIDEYESAFISDLVWDGHIENESIVTYGTGTLSKDICLLKVAKATKDISFCNEIVFPFINGECIIMVAEMLENATFCSRVTHYDVLHDVCILNVGIMTMDISVCGRLWGEIDDKQCVNEIATIAKNISVCEKASTTEHKDYCINRVAIEKRDRSQCYKTDSVKIEKYCNAVLTEDEMFCERTYDHDGCIIDIAILTNDTSFCKRMREDDGYEYCVNKVAVVTNNASLCISTGERKNRCITTIALATNNASICNNVSLIKVWKEIVSTYTEEKDKCIEKVAKITVDASSCDGLSDTYKKDYCILDTAERTENASLCDKISKAAIKKRCDLILAE